MEDGGAKRLWDGTSIATDARLSVGVAGTRRGAPREGGLEAGTVYEEGFNLRQALSASIAVLELQLGVVLRAAEEPSARAGSRGGSSACAQ